MDQVPWELFNPQAFDARRAGVLLPSREELEPLLQGWSGPRPLRVCSGGTTSRSAADAQWTLDLRRHGQSITLNREDGTVRVEGGCQMGDVLRVLAPRGRSIPTGLSGLPGMGYLLTGGMGPLSRAVGLAVDHIQSIAGVWGNGTAFRLTREQHEGSAEWRGLCGAAPFLAVVSEVVLNTQPLQPLWIRRCAGNANQLIDWMAAAESTDWGVSLQWHWGVGNTIEGLWVRQAAAADHQAIDGLHALPPLTSPIKSHQRLHAEVVGLLGPADSSGWRQRMPELQQLMDARPDPSCSLSAQQLGGAVSRVAIDGTSFIHRDAVWKPWITAVWPAGDGVCRQRSLEWLERVWRLLQPICPGVHLAQLHDHLPFHQRELELAFGSWLPGLRKLKHQRDPLGNLPTL